MRHLTRSLTSTDSLHAAFFQSKNPSYQHIGLSNSTIGNRCFIFWTLSAHLKPQNAMLLWQIQEKNGFL